MKPDPTRRKDGRCARPGCSKQLRLPKRPVTKDVPMRVYEQDPFCSSTCCRAFHGCSVISAENEERIERQSRSASATIRRSGYGRREKAVT